VFVKVIKIFPAFPKLFFSTPLSPLKYPVMKRGIFALLLASLLFGSCATIVYEAPANKDLKMATQVDAPPIKIKRKVWYVLWGLVPISSNSTAEMVGLCNEMVKVKSYYGIDDLLINAVSSAVVGGFVMTMTVEIQCK